MNIMIIDGGLTFTILDPPHDYVGSNADTVHIPSSAQAGDFCILLDMALNASAVHPALVAPSGWSPLTFAGGTADTGNLARFNILWKILTSGDPDTDITGMNGTQRNRKIIITMRPSRPILSATPGGWSFRCEAGVPGSILTPSSGASAPGGAVVVFGLAASQNAVSPFSWTPAASDVNTTGTLVTRGGFKLYPTGVTPVDHTIATGDNGDLNGLAAGYFVFT